MSFEKNFFINCPFDREYSDLFKPMVFTIMYLGYTPQICKTEDSSTERIKQIKKLIASSKYSIHDISRNQAKAVGEWPRFNLPFEMGLDFGCKEYGDNTLKQKTSLVFETNRNDYDKYIGDISGQDIKAHEGDPKILIQKLHEWLNIQIEHDIPGPTKIYNLYLDCMTNVTLQLSEPPLEYTLSEINNMDIYNYIKSISNWMKNHKYVYD